MSVFAPALAVANAVLYEGYLLYPYTASAQKNRIRWQFGVIVPEAYAAKGTGEPAEAVTEVLLEAGDDAWVDVLVRFLHVEARAVEAWTGAAYEPVASLAAGARTYVTFDEGVEREVAVRVQARAGAAAGAPVAFRAEEIVEPLEASDAGPHGRIVRRRWALHGAIAVECEAVPSHPALRRLRVRIRNQSGVVPGERSSALRTAFVSTHTLLHAEGARFLSVLDPPEDAAAATAALVNRHTFPVLVGDETAGGQRSALILSSPIILYDFPAVAAQTGGDTFDALEIDELMMLSVRSLSDRERAEARATDPRAREIVDRAERFDASDLNRLHGALETLDVPAFDCVFVDGVKIAKDAKVRLHPNRRADAWDVFLDGKVATVRAIHQDVDDQMYVAVTVDDDPASDLHDWYGRSFFFYPDEVEPVRAAVPEGAP